MIEIPVSRMEQLRFTNAGWLVSVKHRSGDQGCNEARFVKSSASQQRPPKTGLGVRMGGEPARTVFHMYVGYRHIVMILVHEFLEVVHNYCSSWFIIMLLGPSKPVFTLVYELKDSFYWQILLRSGHRSVHYLRNLFPWCWPTVSGVAAKVKTRLMKMRLMSCSSHFKV